MRHNRGMYHSSAATADTLDSDDTLSDLEPLEEDLLWSKEVEIEGLELLLEDQRKIWAEEEDQEDRDAYGEEIDSLVLARRRLPHIWLRRPWKHFDRRKWFEHPVDSLELARERLPQRMVHRGRGRGRGRTRNREGGTGTTKIPELEPVELSQSETEDDSTDYSWDSIANKTVDSLDLNRARLAAERSRPRRRKQGTELLFLTRKGQKPPPGVNPVPRRVLTAKHQAARMTRIMPLLRHHSDGLAKLQSHPNRRIHSMSPVRHHPSGQGQVGRAA